MITEIALAVVLMIEATLLIRTFIEIRKVNPGFDARKCPDDAHVAHGAEVRR